MRDGRALIPEWNVDTTPPPASVQEFSRKKKQEEWMSLRQDDYKERVSSDTVG